MDEIGNNSAIEDYIQLLLASFSAIPYLRFYEPILKYLIQLDR